MLVFLFNDFDKFLFLFVVDVVGVFVVLLFVDECWFCCFFFIGFGIFIRLFVDICKFFFLVEDLDVLELLLVEDFFLFDELVFFEYLFFFEFEGFLFCGFGLLNLNLFRLS